MKCLKHCQLAVPTAKTVTEVAGGTFPSDAGGIAKTVTFQATVAPVRWTDDGLTTPTATVGFLLAIGASFDYQRANIANLKFIEATAGAIVVASFYR